ncbi:MAG: hypothetical protein HOP11_03915 [Saprospiraceae bacterium]|nr:hypothetical protein [Saprospiraceae bacterium]
MRIVLIYIITVFIVNAQDVSSKNLSQTSQNPSDTTITIDSTKTHQEKSSVLKNIFTGKPGRAFVYSLILPGAGQIYNRKWWKLPIVYSALGLPIYFVSFNTKEYRRFDKAFRERVDKGELSTDEFVGIYNLQQININRKAIDKNLQRSYLGLVAVYLLCGMDAYVDRHLMEFDVSEKLSLNLNPTYDGSAGLRLGLSFK